MVRQIAEFLPADDETVFSVSEEPETLTAAQKAVAAAVEQLSSNAEKGSTIRIYRQRGTGQESLEFVEQHPADKYSIDFLIDKMQKEYGGGDYRFMIYNEKGKIAANKLFSIASKIKKADENESGIYSLLHTFMEKQDAMTRELLRHRPAEENSRTKVFEELVLMKQFLGGGEQQNSLGQIKEMMEVMRMLKEEMPGNNESSEMGFSEIMSQSLPLLTEIVKQSRPDTMAAHNPAQPRQPFDRARASLNPLNKVVADLIKYAGKNHSPADIAENLIGKLPEKFVGQLESMILKPDILDKLAGINSEVMKYGDWFADLVEYLKGYLGHPCKYDSEFSGDENDESENDIINLTSNKEKITIDDNEPDHKPIIGDSER